MVTPTDPSPPQDAPDEQLIPDARALLTPSQWVDAKLARLGVAGPPEPTRGPAA